MKNIIYIIIIIIYFPIYAKDSVDIRGYQFGEFYTSILNIENQKKEFKIIPSLTNNNRLAYSGYLLNKPFRLFFDFRNQRLSKITYLWDNLTNEILFHKNIQSLLQQKYSQQSVKNIIAQHSTIEIIQYRQVFTNTNKQITPILSIHLENIKQTNQLHHLILEFQAFDADTKIQNKILSEDI